MDKKLDCNYTRMLRAILNKSWRQHPTKQQLYVVLPPITKTIQVRRTRHAGPCWRSRDELISDIPLWTLLHGRAKTGRPTRTDIQQLFADTGCSFEDLSGGSALATWHDDNDVSLVKDHRTCLFMRFLFLARFFESVSISKRSAFDHIDWSSWRSLF